MAEILTDEHKAAVVVRVETVCRALDAYLDAHTENRLEAMKAALTAVDYFALLKVAEAAKTLTSFPAVGIVLESECTARLNDAYKRLLAALKGLPQATGEAKDRG